MIFIRYTTSFYTHYFTRYPELCVVAECVDAETIAGYIIGKVEGSSDSTGSSGILSPTVVLQVRVCATTRTYLHCLWHLSLEGQELLAN